jgi:hypothetical protein
MWHKEKWMMEDDKLRATLREWEAPDPNPAMDARVQAAWRDSHPGLWKRIWTARVSIPVPVLAALLLIAAFLVVKLGLMSAPAIRYASRPDSTGFQPVPNGEARVITVKEDQ